jgi:phosphomannomutase/phosphoglucomutase
MLSGVNMSTASLQFQDLPRNIFRAYDIRGIVGEQLDEKLMENIGLAIGSEALVQACTSIVIARDGRLSGPSLLAALTRGLLRTGINVIDVGCVPSPVLYFATLYYKTSCGAIVTGSHNPGNYNGVKIMIAGKTVAGEDVQRLYHRIQQQDYVYNIGSLQENFIIQEYINEVCSKIKLNKKLKLVIDSGNGAAGVIAAKLYRALGCEVISLFEEVDGNFPNHHPDPSDFENLKDLQQAVLENAADLGLAFDGDADRLGVVTNKAAIIIPDRQLMLFARAVLRNNPGANIVYDIKCSSHLSVYIKNHNGIPCMWKTGHSFMKNKMRENNALLAGEMSGHIFFKERWHGFDDALYAGARLLEILANDFSNKTLDELYNELPGSVNTPELNIPIADEHKFEFINKIKMINKFVNFKNIIDIDGLRVEYQDGWGLVRASNTSPCLVLRFEADNKDALTRIISEFQNVMRLVDPSIRLNLDKYCNSTGY